MAYAILRIEKRKQSDIKRALQHNHRERIPLNANPDLFNQNQYVGTTEEALKRIAQLKKRTRAITGRKIRSDANVAVEVLLTATGDFFVHRKKLKTKQFAERARDFVYAEFGAERVLSVSLHRDETTPHLHIFLLPEVDGKLNCKAFIGGHRDRLRRLQDRFAKAMAPLGLERGNPKRGARHTTIKEWYAQKLNDEKTLHQFKQKLEAALRENEQARELIEMLKKRIAEYEKQLGIHQVASY